MARLPSEPPLPPADGDALAAGEPSPNTCSLSFVSDVQAAVAQIERRMASAHTSASSLMGTSSASASRSALGAAFAPASASGEYAPAQAAASVSLASVVTERVDQFERSGPLAMTIYEDDALVVPPPAPMVKLFETPVEPGQSELQRVSAAVPFDDAEPDPTLPEVTSSSIADVVQRFEAAVSSFESTVTNDLPAPDLDILTKPCAAAVEQFENPAAADVPAVETVEVPSVPIAPIVEQFEAPVEAHVPAVEAVEMPSVPIAQTVEQFETQVEAKLPAAKHADIPSVPIASAVEQFEAPVATEIIGEEPVEEPSVSIAPTVEQFETPVEAIRVPVAKPVDIPSVPIATTIRNFEDAVETEIPASGQVEMPSVPIAQIVEQFETPVDTEALVAEPIDMPSIPIAPAVGQFEARDATDVPEVESGETPSVLSKPIVESSASPVEAEAPVEETIDFPSVPIAPTVLQVEAPIEADVPTVEHIDVNVGPVVPIVEQFEAPEDFERPNAKTADLKSNYDPIASVVEKFEESTDSVTAANQQLHPGDSQIVAAAAEHLAAASTVEAKAEIVDAKVVAETMETVDTTAEPEMRTDHAHVSSSKVSAIIHQLETPSARVVSQNDPLDAVPAPGTSALEQDDISTETDLPTEQNCNSGGAQAATAVEEFETYKDVGELTRESRENRPVVFARTTTTTGSLETGNKSAAEMFEQNGVSLENTALMVQVGAQSAKARAADEAHVASETTASTFGQSEILGTLEAEASIDTEQNDGENTGPEMVSDGIHTVSLLPESVPGTQDNSLPLTAPTLEHFGNLGKGQAGVSMEQKGVDSLESVPIVEKIGAPAVSFEATPRSLETTSSSATTLRVNSPAEPEIISEAVAVCETEAAVQEHPSEKVSKPVEAKAEAVETEPTTSANALTSNILEASAESEPTSGTTEVSTSLVSASMQKADPLPDPVEMEKESAETLMSPVRTTAELSPTESAIPPSEPVRAVDNGIVSEQELNSLDAATENMVPNRPPSTTPVVRSVPHMEQDERAALPKSADLDGQEEVSILPTPMLVAASEAAVVGVAHNEARSCATLPTAGLFDVPERTTQQLQDESRDPYVPFSPISLSFPVATAKSQSLAVPETEIPVDGSPEKSDKGLCENEEPNLMRDPATELTSNEKRDDAIALPTSPELSGEQVPIADEMGAAGDALVDSKGGEKPSEAGTIEQGEEPATGMNEAVENLEADIGSIHDIEKSSEISGSPAAGRLTETEMTTESNDEIVPAISLVKAQRENPSVSAEQKTSGESAYVPAEVVVTEQVDQQSADAALLAIQAASQSDEGYTDSGVALLSERSPDVVIQNEELREEVSVESSVEAAGNTMVVDKEITDEKGSAAFVMFDLQNPEYFVAGDHDTAEDENTTHAETRSTAEETVTVSSSRSEEEANMHTKSAVQGERIAAEMTAPELTKEAHSVVADPESSSESASMELVDDPVVSIEATVAFDKAALPSTPVKPSSFQSEILGSPVTPNVEVPVKPSSQTSEEGDAREGTTMSTRTRLSQRLSRGSRTFTGSLPTDTSKPQRPGSSVTRRGSMLAADDVAEIKNRSKALAAGVASSPPVHPAPGAGRAPRTFTTGNMRKSFSPSPRTPSADCTSPRLPRVAELAGNEDREMALSRLRLSRGATFSGTVPHTRTSISHGRTPADVSVSSATPGTHANGSDNDSTASTPVTSSPKSRLIKRTMSFTHNRRSTMAGTPSVQTPSSLTKSPVRAPFRSNSVRLVVEASGSPNGKKLDRRATMSLSEPSRARPPKGPNFTLPPFSPPKLPRNKPTVPQPFRLSGLEHHEKSVQQIEEARRRADENERRRRSFKARPMPDFSNPYPKPHF